MKFMRRQVLSDCGSQGNSDIFIFDQPHERAEILLRSSAAWFQMKLMRLVLSDSGSRGNSAIFSLHPCPQEGSGISPKHDHCCDVDGSKLFKGGLSGHAYDHQPPIIDENLPGMNPSIMPEVEAEFDPQRPASSSEKVGGWGRTWIIGLISLFLIVVLSAGSTGSLLVQVEDGEREGGGGGGGGCR